jgi:hypothetical protein
MTELEKQETRVIVAKMVAALRKHGDDYATGYLESLIVGLITNHVTDRSDLSLVHMRMLTVGIDHLIDAPRSK